MLSAPKDSSVSLHKISMTDFSGSADAKREPQFGIEWLSMW